MAVWEERAARNEALFRSVNEEVARLEERLRGGGDTAEFICECADDACVERVRVPLAEYEELRSHPRRFVVTPGHETAAVERVVAETDRYRVVEKTGTAGVIADRTDPRPDG